MRLSNMHTATRWMAFGLLSLVVSAAQAASVTITDGGSDFSVTYDTETTGLFGTPILRNNTIFFIPNEFHATSTNGAGQFITTSTIHLELNATTPGFSMESFSVQERGDYVLDGAGAEVSVLGEMRVFAADNPFVDFVGNLQIDPAHPININDGGNHDWVATANIGMDSGWTSSDSVFLTLENILIAETTNANTLAFIEKKFEGVQITVSQVPIPSGALLFGSALVALGWRRLSK